MPTPSFIPFPAFKKADNVSYDVPGSRFTNRSYPSFVRGAAAAAPVFQQEQELLIPNQNQLRMMNPQANDMQSYYSSLNLRSVTEPHVVHHSSVDSYYKNTIQQQNQHEHNMYATVMNQRSNGGALILGFPQVTNAAGILRHEPRQRVADYISNNGATKKESHDLRYPSSLPPIQHNSYGRQSHVNFLNLEQDIFHQQQNLQNQIDALTSATLSRNEQRRLAHNGRSNNIGAPPHLPINLRPSHSFTEPSPNSVNKNSIDSNSSPATNRHDDSFYFTNKRLNSPTNTTKSMQNVQKNENSIRRMTTKVQSPENPIKHVLLLGYNATSHSKNTNISNSDNKQSNKEEANVKRTDTNGTILSPIHDPKLDKSTVKNISLHNSPVPAAKELLESNSMTSFEESFEQMILLLECFYKIHHHSKVPCDGKEYPGLYSWCSTIRKAYRFKVEGKVSDEFDLTDAMIDRLNEFDFQFICDLKDIPDTVEANLKKLADYKEKHGDLRSLRSNDSNLALWIDRVKNAPITRNQRTKIISPYSLTESQHRRLLALGIDDINQKAKFDERFEELLIYKEKHGHPNVPKRSDRDVTLGYWCCNIRKSYKKNSLSKEHIQKLLSIGFELEPNHLDLNQLIDRLKDYKREYGHLKISEVSDYNANYPGLRTWCWKLRNSYYLMKQGKMGLPVLDDDHIARLKRIGFDFRMTNDAKHEIDSDSAFKKEPSFEHRMNQLKQFKKEYGHLNVQISDNEKYPGLGTWCYRTKSALKDQSYSKEQIKKLRSIGFEFGFRHMVTFEERLEQLKRHKAMYGHLKVRHDDPNFPYLNNWCCKVKVSYGHRMAGFDYGSLKLTDERVEKLEEIGFDFSKKYGKNTTTTNEKKRSSVHIGNNNLDKVNQRKSSRTK